MTREQLFILSLLAFVLLISFAARLLKRRVAGEVPRAREAERLALPPRVHSLPPAVVPRQFYESPGTATLPLVMPPATPRPQARAALGDLWAVRRGIVLMTILGPCRGLEPPDRAS
jgi:hypothetical protein